MEPSLNFNIERKWLIVIGLKKRRDMGGGGKEKKQVNYLTFKAYSLEVPLYNLNPQPRLKIRESAVNY